MNPSSRIAGALAASAQDQEVMDFLYERAQPTNVPSQPAIGPSERVAAKYFKKDLASAMAVASAPKTPRPVLEKFAKDSRVNVRYALLGNPSTPSSVAIELAAWATDRGDTQAWSRILRRLTPEEIVALVEGPQRDALTRFRCIPTTELADKVTKAEDAGLVRRLYAIGDAELNVRLAVHARLGNVAGVSLTELVESHEDSFKHVVAALATMLPHRATNESDEPALLTVELADLLRRSASQIGPFKRFEPEAVDVLARSPERRVAEWAFTRGASPQALVETVPTADCDYLSAVLKAIPKGVGIPETAQRALVDRFHAIDPDRRFPVAAVLERLTIPVDDGSVLAMLRCDGRSTTGAWIKGSYVPKPTLTLLEQLLDEPGLAFLQRESWRFAQGVPTAPTDRSDCLMAIRSDLIASDVEEIAAFAVVTFDEFLGSKLSDPQVAKAVYPMLRARLGDDIAMWETLLTLASEWQGSLSGLLTTTVALTDPAV